jgi:hypothetical protein
MGEWRYSSTILDLGTGWRIVIRFTPRSLCPRGTSSRYPLEMRRGGLGTVEKKKLLSLPGIETRPSSRMLYPLSNPDSYGRIKSELISRNARCHFVQNRLSLPVIFTCVNIEIYGTIILPVVLYGCDTLPELQ